MDMQEINTRINAEVTRCMEVASLQYGRPFEWPAIDYCLRGSTAGTARVRQNRVSLNGDLLKANPEEMITQTLPHEIAHIIDYVMHPENFLGYREIRSPFTGEMRRVRVKRQLHGPTWARIMRDLGKEPTRCHQMDTTLTKTRVVRRHQYKCPVCGYLFVVGAKHHNLLRRGSTYTIKTCGHWFSARDRVGLAPETQRVLAVRNARK